MSGPEKLIITAHLRTIWAGTPADSEHAGLVV